MSPTRPCALFTATLASTILYGAVLAAALRPLTGNPAPRFIPSFLCLDVLQILAALSQFLTGSSALLAIPGLMLPICACASNTLATSPYLFSLKHFPIQTRVSPRSLTFCAATAIRAASVCLRIFTCAPRHHWHMISTHRINSQIMMRPDDRNIL